MFIESRGIGVINLVHTVILNHSKITIHHGSILCRYSFIDTLSEVICHSHAGSGSNLFVSSCEPLSLKRRSGVLCSTNNSLSQVRSSCPPGETRYTTWTTNSIIVITSFLYASRVEPIHNQTIN